VLGGSTGAAAPSIACSSRPPIPATVPVVVSAVSPTVSLMAAVVSLTVSLTAAVVLVTVSLAIVVVLLTGSVVLETVSVTVSVVSPVVFSTVSAGSVVVFSRPSVVSLGTVLEAVGRVLGRISVSSVVFSVVFSRLSVVLSRPSLVFPVEFVVPSSVVFERVRRRRHDRADARRSGDGTRVTAPPRSMAATRHAKMRTATGKSDSIAVVNP